jgi:hypothetical protein
MIASKEKWRDFLRAESPNYAQSGLNRLCHAVDPLVRYEWYVRTIFSRHSVLTREFQLLSGGFQDMLTGASRGGHQLSSEQQRLLLRRGQLSGHISMEIETFYLFAKILLDRIAIFIEHYFGQLRGVSIHSHDKLTKNLPRFLRGHSMDAPHGLQSTLSEVKRRIADFRDYQIAHEQGSQTIRGTLWKPGEEPRLVMAPAHPSTRKEGTVQAESESLGVLVAEIDFYIDCVQALVAANRDRCRFLTPLA